MGKTVDSAVVGHAGEVALGGEVLHHLGGSRMFSCGGDVYPGAT